MSSNFGRLFRLTTFGESHGVAIGGIVDGCPAGIELSEADLQVDLDRRKPGQNKFVSPRKEADAVKILSGVFEGITTGTPIGLLIENTNVRSQDYGDVKDQFRPGHADFTYLRKYGIRDHRGGGRASARETAVRVAAGGIAKQILAKNKISVMAWLTQIGEIPSAFSGDYPEWKMINGNPFFSPDDESVEKWTTLLSETRRAKDSVGAKLRVIARNVPVGLGEPLFDKLDAQIASAMMGIPAVKAVSIGAGFDCVTQKGTTHGDSMRVDANGEMQFLSNHAGGIVGGISSGQDIVVDMAIKPTSSIGSPRQSVDIYGNNVDIITEGRHDPCVGIRAVPIAEAMLALVLCDALLLQRSAQI